MKYIETESNIVCPKCLRPMTRRSWKNFKSNKHYYFSEWDVCKTCRHLQFYEKYKVINNEPKLEQMTMF